MQFLSASSVLERCGGGGNLARREAVVAGPLVRTPTASKSWGSRVRSGIPPTSIGDCIRCHRSSQAPFSVPVENSGLIIFLTGFSIRIFISSSWNAASTQPEALLVKADRATTYSFFHLPNNQILQTITSTGIDQSRGIFVDHQTTFANMSHGN